jgi:hypothetical protein
VCVCVFVFVCKMKKSSGPALVGESWHVLLFLQERCMLVVLSPYPQIIGTKVLQNFKLVALKYYKTSNVFLVPQISEILESFSTSLDSVFLLLLTPYLIPLDTTT